VDWRLLRGYDHHGYHHASPEVSEWLLGGVVWMPTPTTYWGMRCHRKCHREETLGLGTI
jgi:hypothetical protein